MVLPRTQPGLRSAAAVLLAALAVSSAAHADAESDAHVRRGVELRKEDRNEEALAEFRLALARERSPTARAQVALAEQALGHWLDAETHLAEALAAVSDPWIERNRPQLEEAMAVIGKHLGWLEVTVNVDAAEMLLDGRALGRTKTRVLAGMAVLQVRAPGYIPDIRRIEVAPGTSSTTVDVTLAPFVAEVSPKLPAAAPVQTANDASSRDGSASLLGPVIVGAVGVAALATGAYLGVRAAREKGERDAHCDAQGCDDVGLEADADDGNSATVATVAFVAGGALAAGGITWLLVTRKPARARVSIAPIVDPRGGAAGIFLRGDL